MLELPNEFVLFDTEYTSWEGAQERKWSGPGEHREIIQIGALKVGNDLIEKESFMAYVKPTVNPTLSDYIIELTGITQEKINDTGLSFGEALQKFEAWSGGLPLWSFGRDLTVVEENCELNKVDYPFTGCAEGDVRDIFHQKNFSIVGYTSGTILKAFGKELPSRAHDAVNDMRNLLAALRELAKRG